MVAGSTIRERLEAWRTAERRWEATPPDDPSYGAARDEVLAAWLAYQEAAGSIEADEMVLVADDELRYVGANTAAHRLLGYANGEIVGLRIADLTPPEEAHRVASMWDSFRLAGRLDGEYTLSAKDGSLVPARFVARAHFPVAKLHTSRLTLNPKPYLLEGRALLGTPLARSRGRIDEKW